MERSKIDAEYKEVSSLISKLQGILDDPQKVLDVIVEEFKEIRDRYGDERRTEIVASTEDIDIEDLIVEEDMVVRFPTRDTSSAMRRASTGASEEEAREK